MRKDLARRISNAASEAFAALPTGRGYRIPDIRLKKVARLVGK